MTATYWEIGRRLVEVEQGGQARAEYGAQLLKRLSTDLTTRFGRGFSVDNLENMRQFYLAYAGKPIPETGENPPIGLILCEHKDAAVAHYAGGPAQYRSGRRIPRRSAR